MHAHSIFRFAVFLALALPLPTAAAEGALTYPPAAKRPVAETFHGVTVVDDYRWMEDVGASDVKAGCGRRTR